MKAEEIKQHESKKHPTDFENARILSLEKSFNGEIDIDLDGYHEVLLLLSKKYRFEYERRKK